MKALTPEDGWRGFLEQCAKLKTPELLDEYFKLILTLEEQEALALRCLIVNALLEGKQSQREIAENLKVSISKITRGSNALKIISNRLRDELVK